MYLLNGCYAIDSSTEILLKLCNLVSTGSVDNMIPSSDSSFGALLKQLRKRAGMTEADLAAAVGYSVPFISNLELNQRLPDVQMVMQMFAPALGLQDDPQMTVHLIEQAAVARGERPPVSITQQRVIQVQVQAELEMRTVSLPAPPTPLIGRSATVNQLANRLQGHSGRLLTLVGPPGAGKTTLALAVAAHLQLHYRDGAVFVALAAISEPTLMAATILAAAGSSDSSPKPPQTKLIEFLRRKTMLLVLDNLEQIGGAAPLIAELVSECPGLCILATSRERLHLRAEQRFKVPPLDLAPAIELFVQRAQAVEPDFRLTPHNQPTLEAICQRLDCLPLALELCAAQVDLLAPSQLLAHLQDRRSGSAGGGAHDLPLRQRALRTAIGRSYALLNEDEASLLRSLGIFVGGCDRHGGGSDCRRPGATSARSLHSTLHALVGKSLVRAETLPNGEQRFLLLETIREFALEQVRTQGEEAWLRQRHFAIYLQLFRIGDSHLRRTEAATWLVRLKPEQDNLRAALQWALDEAHYMDAAWLMIAACWFWLCRGNRYEQGRWLAQLLPHRQTLAADQRMVILQNLHGVAHTWEEFQPVDRWTDEMMQLLEVCPQKLLQAATWFSGVIYAADFSPAAWEQSIALTRAAGKRQRLVLNFASLADRDFVLVSSLWEYANTLIERGEVALGCAFRHGEFRNFPAAENQYEIADGLGTLGILALLKVISLSPIDTCTKR